ncbi:biotin--[acetyl-CoA-carboxylase] ligase [Thermococcus sp.]|uniref:biotin--[acetyl-CoA-carboxylase] ligase n=2 Tax=Thermococcus sp. TaxID=35749 RepID=UPI002624575E|nr:biotin--[acetyl-CoA-carboxylase] ligase [Thermococcus sp.]
MEWNIITLDEVDSTNEYARRIAPTAPEGTVVVAKRQTAGRGRNGRRWASPEGGLWMTAILKPKSSPEHVPKLVFVGALAVVDALAKYGIPAEVKWPNDVLVDGKKIAGVLSECKFNHFALLGIGLNVNNEVPEELLDKAVSMRELTGFELNLDDVLSNVLRALSYWYSLFKRGRHYEILDAVRRKSAVIGRHVMVVEGDEVLVEGRALDIDDSGALLVETKNGVERVFYGDVSLRVF